MVRIILLVILVALIGITIGAFFLMPRLMWYPLSRSISFGDLDGDGDMDAIIGNGHTDDTGEENIVLLNDGRGRFTDTGQRLGENYEDTSAVGLVDLDGDGDLDAIFGNNRTYSIWKNSGQGQFSRITGLSIGIESPAGGPGGSSGYFGGMAIGDVNADGQPDIVAGSCCRGEWAIMDNQETIQSGINDSYNLLFFNNGGRFELRTQRIGNDSTGAVALGDLNGNGSLDLFIVNRRGYSEGEYIDQVWFNDGLGTFTNSGQRLGESSGSAVALGDLDGDGDLDVYVGNSYYPRTPRDMNNDASRIDQVWLNDGSGQFSPGPQPNGLVDTTFAALADLDNDGDMDAFVASRSESFILWNDGQGNLSQLGPSFTPGRNYAYQIADVDGDGLIDVFAFHLTRGYTVWRNSGNGEFQRQR
jgi:hypothetical protein